MINHPPFQAQPTSPELMKKVEKSIIREAKDEGKSLKHVVKDLEAVEKAARKAHKTTDKADHHLGSAEKNEHGTLKALHRAEHVHDRAVSDVHQAQNDLQMERRNLEKTQQNLQAKKAQVDAAIKVNDEHTSERNAKLAALRSPTVTTETSRVIAETTDSRAGAAGSIAA